MLDQTHPDLLPTPLDAYGVKPFEEKKSLKKRSEKKKKGKSAQKSKYLSQTIKFKKVDLSTKEAVIHHM